MALQYLGNKIISGSEISAQGAVYWWLELASIRATHKQKDKY